MRPHWRCIKSLLALWLAAILTACSPQPDTLWQDYRARLSRVLNKELPDQPILHHRALPAAVSPAQAATAPESQLSLIQVHQARSCGLDQLAGERNNQLGKVMTASVRLHYELRLLAALPACITHPALPAALQQQLAGIYQHKQQTITRYWQQFLQQDSTLRQQLSGSRRGLPLQSVSSADTQQALRQLLTLKTLIQRQQYQQAALIDIEAALSQLYQSQLLADLQYSLWRSHDQLQQLNLQLAQLSDNQLCKASSNVRDNLLQQIFIGRVQQHLALLAGLSEEMTPLLLELYQQHPLSETVQQRFSTPSAGLKTALAEHVRFWQRWQRCNQAKQPT